MKIPESSNEKKAVSSGSCGSEVWERTWTSPLGLVEVKCGREHGYCWES
jgi:hypothetical protein